MRTLLAVLTLGVVLSGCDNREAPVPYGKPSAPDGKVIKQAQVKDPVCGMMIDSDKAKDHTYKDVKYYFCSKECHDKFEKAPATYVANPAK
jgi:YHS domain-containing protein